MAVSMQEGIRVLVADDDPDIRELVEFKLAQAGYAVTAVPTAPRRGRRSSPTHPRSRSST